MLNDECGQIDVVEWRKRLRETIMSIDAQIREIQQQLQSLVAEQERMVQEEIVMDQAVTAYSARMRSGTDVVPIAGNSLREVLIINFATSDGIITGRDATLALLDIGYFSSRSTADGAIYSTLAKHPFTKVDKGIYRISTDSLDWMRLRGTNGHRDIETLVENALPELDVDTDTSAPGDRTVTFEEQVDAVVAVARQQNGQMRPGVATRILKERGLFNNPNAIGLAVLRVLQKSKKFIKIERGLYQLQDTADVDPSTSPPQTSLILL